MAGAPTSKTRHGSRLCEKGPASRLALACNMREKIEAQSTHIWVDGLRSEELDVNIFDNSTVL